MYMNKIWKTIKSIFWVAAITAALLIIASSFNLFGYQMYMVKSGSMEPKIQTGSVVINHRADSYGIGDVITFKTGPEGTVTHRVVSVQDKDGSKEYVVKGDANKANDPENVAAKNINGKVLFSIPFVGYLIAFMRTLPGLLVFIIIPAIIIVADEISNIKIEASKIASKRKKKTSKAEVNAGVALDTPPETNKATDLVKQEIPDKQPEAKKRLIQ